MSGSWEFLEVPKNQNGKKRRKGKKNPENPKKTFRTAFHPGAFFLRMWLADKR
ncbi:hypothetical protein OPIT5_19720 [Opitutaceae bacterium TAV5]|nr:hypothetical protein OPIT5_19720 [Opitutaceae bacterium TAV5]